MSLDLWIRMATSEIEDSPNEVCIRNIILELLLNNNLDYPVYHYLEAQSHNVSIWKSLVLIHKIFQKGPYSFLNTSYAKLAFFDHIKNKLEDDIYRPLILYYVDLLKVKIKFHYYYPVCGRDYNRDTSFVVNYQKRMSILIMLLGLQDSVLTLGLETLKLNDNLSIMSCWPLILLESQNIHRAFMKHAEFYILETPYMVTFTDMMDTFKMQYDFLKEFYQKLGAKSGLDVEPIPNEFPMENYPQIVEHLWGMKSIACKN